MRCDICKAKGAEIMEDGEVLCKRCKELLEAAAEAGRQAARRAEGEQNG